MLMVVPSLLHVVLLPNRQTDEEESGSLRWRGTYVAAFAIPGAAAVVVDRSDSSSFGIALTLGQQRWSNALSSTLAKAPLILISGTHLHSPFVPHMPSPGVFWSPEQRMSSCIPLNMVPSLHFGTGGRCRNRR
jgi:hypothetical protein